MTNQPADGERPWQFGIVKYVSRDRIANSKDDVLARYRKDAREQVAINVFAELPNDETVMLAVRETMEPDSSTKSVVVRIVADVTRLPHALAAMHKLKAALAAAAEQLRESNNEMAKLITENERLVRCYQKYSVSVRNACTVLGGELFLAEHDKARLYAPTLKVHDYLRKLVDDVDKMMGETK